MQRKRNAANPKGVGVRTEELSERVEQGVATVRRLGPKETSVEMCFA